MSILGEITETPVTTAPAAMESPASVLMFVAVLLVIAGVVGWRLGVFRRGKIGGRRRLPPWAPVSHLLRLTMLSAAVWIMSQILYAALRPPPMTASDLAFLGTAPALLGAWVLLSGDEKLNIDLFRRLGLTQRNARWAIWPALLAMLAVMPLVWAASGLLQLFYDSVGYQHPEEHEMLGAMKDAALYARVLLAIGACVVAPVYEEMLFRGHIQTIAVRVMRGFAGGGGAARWAAVIGTSILFALVHPFWMAPLIFVLALCLGYAYERTGNLWVPILMHALFNTINTVQFLILR
jgi:membrane protease YdiL (CAAX protease family)